MGRWPGVGVELSILQDLRATQHTQRQIMSMLQDFITRRRYCCQAVAALRFRSVCWSAASSCHDSFGEAGGIKGLSSAYCRTCEES
jgi:hypothetical protein